MVATAKRIGWSVRSATKFLDDKGVLYDLPVDPPIVIVDAVRCSVRRWRLARVAAQFPGLVPERLDYGAEDMQEYGRQYPDGTPMLPVDVIDLTGQWKKLLYGRNAGIVIGQADQPSSVQWAPVWRSSLRYGRSVEPGQAGQGLPGCG